MLAYAYVIIYNHFQICALLIWLSEAFGVILIYSLCKFKILYFLS